MSCFLYILFDILTFLHGIQSLHKFIYIYIYIYIYSVAVSECIPI